jgi:DNA-directed RNA polymerase specialized sigma24 family protein
MKTTELMQICRERLDTIRELQQKKNDLEEAMVSLGAACDQTIRGAAGDRYAAYMARKDALERAIRREEKMRAFEQVAIIMLTQDLPGKHRDALRLYYCRGKNAQDICKVPCMTCDERTVERYLQAGRAAMERVPDWEVESVLPHWYPVKGGNEA